MDLCYINGIRIGRQPTVFRILSQTQCRCLCLMAYNAAAIDRLGLGRLSYSSSAIGLSSLSALASTSTFIALISALRRVNLKTHSRSVLCGSLEVSRVGNCLIDTDNTLAELLKLYEGWPVNERSHEICALLALLSRKFGSNIARTLVALSMLAVTEVSHEGSRV